MSFFVVVAVESHEKFLVWMFFEVEHFFFQKQAPIISYFHFSSDLFFHLMLNYKKCEAICEIKGLFEPVLWPVHQRFSNHKPTKKNPWSIFKAMQEFISFPVGRDRIFFSFILWKLIIECLRCWRRIEKI